jgi:hypothetical protein
MECKEVERCDRQQQDSRLERSACAKPNHWDLLAGLTTCRSAVGPPPLTQRLAPTAVAARRLQRRVRRRASHLALRLNGRSITRMRLQVSGVRAASVHPTVAAGNAERSAWPCFAAYLAFPRRTAGAVRADAVSGEARLPRPRPAPLGAGVRSPTVQPARALEIAERARCHNMRLRQPLNPSAPNDLPFSRRAALCGATTGADGPCGPSAATAG